MGPDAFLPVAFIIGYLFGSIPFGLVLTKLAGTADLRSIGSGSIGATNVLRTGRKGLAVATLLFDALKGTAAVVIGGYFGGPNAAILAGGDRVLPDLARDGVLVPLLLAVGAGRELRDTAVPVVVRPPRAGLAIRRADLAGVLCPSREHQAVAGGNRGADRTDGLARCVAHTPSIPVRNSLCPLAKSNDACHRALWVVSGSRADRNGR